MWGREERINGFFPRGKTCKCLGILCWRRRSMIYLCLEENTQMLSDEVQVLAWRLENGLEVGVLFGGSIRVKNWWGIVAKEKVKSNSGSSRNQATTETTGLWFIKQRAFLLTLPNSPSLHLATIASFTGATCGLGFGKEEKKNETSREGKKRCEKSECNEDKNNWGKKKQS